MKRLTLIRHGKSDWSSAAKTDFDRPLNKRGEKAAPLMGQRLAVRGCLPDLLVSSPATRARRTAELIASKLEYLLTRIKYDQDIYEADLKCLVELLQTLDDSASNVILFGHNPGFSELGRWLTPQAPDWLPTCGLLELDLPVDRWSEVDTGCAVLRHYDFPKNPE